MSKDAADTFTSPEHMFKQMSEPQFESMIQMGFVKISVCGRPMF